MCDLRGSLGRRNRQQLNTNRNLFCVRPHSRRFILVAEEKWISRSSFICSSIMPGTDDLEALVVQQEAKRFENFHESVLHLHELLEELDNVALKRKMRQALTRIEGKKFCECSVEKWFRVNLKLSHRRSMYLTYFKVALSNSCFSFRNCFHGRPLMAKQSFVAFCSTICILFSFLFRQTINAT